VAQNFSVGTNNVRKIDSHFDKHYYTESSSFLEQANILHTLMNTGREL
jgi:hypothetical protein